MADFIELTKKNDTIIELDVLAVSTTNESYLKLSDYLNQPLPLLIEHFYTNDLVLEIESIKHYTMLYFDNSSSCIGYIKSKKIKDAKQIITVNASWIVIIPNLDFKCKKIRWISTYNTSGEERGVQDELLVEGYGIFPYIIQRLHSSVFRQIPIRFNVDENQANNKEILINNISEEDLANYRINKKSPLHDIIMNHCEEFKQKLMIENPGLSNRFCLVEDPETAYYFEANNVINFSNSIPDRGQLLSVDNELIGLNVHHYIKNQPNCENIKL